MKLVGKSPHFTIQKFELGTEETAKFIYNFLENGDLILFPYFEVNLKWEEEEWKSFIINRTVFKSDYWSFGGSYHNNVSWINPSNPQELIRIIKKEGFNFILYVISSFDKDIENHKFEIRVAEHTVDDENIENEEFVAMFINENNEGNFEEKVLPSLRKNYTL
ncbi:hypothetical protein [Bacillus sp. FJAT-27245]|uniref:hypothetical protein n=1 Tax=Bacillus sp. FJAT-27245 TaxID=1684144 RepID=UPI0006A76588|nr:hypothetical protein [Bacillus sp. FJAT-27245]